MKWILLQHCLKTRKETCFHNTETCGSLILSRFTHIYVAFKSLTYFVFPLQTLHWLGADLYNELLGHYNTLTGSKKESFCAGDIIDVSFAALQMMSAKISPLLRQKLETSGYIYYYLMQLGLSQGSLLTRKCFLRFEFDSHIGMLKSLRVTLIGWHSYGSIRIFWHRF